MSELVGSKGGTVPAGWMIWRLGSAAIAGSIGIPYGFATPKVWSKWCRSLAIVGEPNESTIAIVWPVPSMPAPWSPARSYAFSNWAGE
jgi:hypothetical protein